MILIRDGANSLAWQPAGILGTVIPNHGDAYSNVMYSVYFCTSNPLFTLHGPIEGILTN